MMSKETYLVQTEIYVELDTGSTIHAICGVPEEMHIIESICSSLREQGAKVTDVKVIRQSNVTGIYSSKFRGGWQ